MPSSSSTYSSYPKSCLKRPSAFPVIHPSDLSEYDHEYDMSSSSMREWDSLFTPGLSATCTRSSRGTTLGSDGRSIMSTSTSDCGSSRHAAKSVSFCDVNDIHVYTPEPLPPERPRGVVARLLQACAYALRLDDSPSQVDAGCAAEDECEE
ncbi:hypothetical protein V8D89_013537 [Ganoderma adspersum]